MGEINLPDKVKLFCGIFSSEVDRLEDKFKKLLIKTGDSDLIDAYVDLKKEIFKIVEDSQKALDEAVEMIEAYEEERSTR